VPKGLRHKNAVFPFHAQHHQAYSDTDFGNTAANNNCRPCREPVAPIWTAMPPAADEAPSRMAKSSCCAASACSIAAWRPLDSHTLMIDASETSADGKVVRGRMAAGNARKELTRAKKISSLPVRRRKLSSDRDVIGSSRRVPRNVRQVNNLPSPPGISERVRGQGSRGQCTPCRRPRPQEMVEFVLGWNWACKVPRVRRGRLNGFDPSAEEGRGGTREHRFSRQWCMDQVCDTRASEMLRCDNQTLPPTLSSGGAVRVRSTKCL
jgi:hypothetical protein